jgi:hypothetical protein
LFQAEGELRVAVIFAFSVALGPFCPAQVQLTASGVTDLSVHFFLWDGLSRFLWHGPILSDFDQLLEARIYACRDPAAV